MESGGRFLEQTKKKKKSQCYHTKIKKSRYREVIDVLFQFSGRRQQILRDNRLRTRGKISIINEDLKSLKILFKLKWRFYIVVGWVKMVVSFGPHRLRT